MREHCIKIRAKAHQGVPFQTRSATCRTLRRQDALQDESRQAKLSGSQTVYFQKVRLVLNATVEKKSINGVASCEFYILTVIVVRWFGHSCKTAVVSPLMGTGDGYWALRRIGAAGEGGGCPSLARQMGGGAGEEERWVV